ncbi:MAG: hypothetical protein MZV70_56815 [Desulfobacterales bacterium]|nr:hypothetical protein [Desulfobacterales bacterium]
MLDAIMDKLIVKGARENNLKNIDLELPRDKLDRRSPASPARARARWPSTPSSPRASGATSSRCPPTPGSSSGSMDKPDVDYIEGLSPAISIEQKTTHRNPRSTVGTVTEIYDYLPPALRPDRHAPLPAAAAARSGSRASTRSWTPCMSWPAGTKLQVLAPVVRGQEGRAPEGPRGRGASRASSGRGSTARSATSTSEISLDKQKKHSIEIVVDRLKLSEDGTAAPGRGRRGRAAR